MDSGEYVPDEITNLMVRDRIDQPDAEPGFLLDGYPRTLDQVKELDGMIAFTGHRLDAAVALTVDEDEIVQRLLQRAESEGRADDTEDVIRRRQEVYAEQTAPAHRRLPQPGHPGRGRRAGRGRRRHRPHLRRPRRRPRELSRRPRWPSAIAASRSRAANRSISCGWPACSSDRPSSCCAPPYDRASPPQSWTPSPRTTSARTAASRPSRATGTRRSRPPSARRSTTRSCTASPVTGCWSRAT